MWPVVATLVDFVESREQTAAVFALRFQVKGHDIGDIEGIARGGVLVGAEVADLLGGERISNLLSTQNDELKIGHFGAVPVVLVDEVAIQDALPWLEVPFQFLDEWSLDGVLLNVQSVALNLRCQLSLTLKQHLILRKERSGVRDLLELELPQRTVVVNRTLVSMNGSSVPDLALLQ
jgi:hypothetical protein